MTEQKFANLIILLRLDYHAELRFVNLNILLKLDFYDLIIANNNYIIKIFY
jgi:hypothetical protein